MQMLTPNKILKALAVFAGCTFVVFYMYRQAIGMKKNVLLTETALLVSIENSISAQGYILRDETVVKSNQNGTVFSVIQDGKKVASGKPIANVYADEADLINESRIDEIDSQLKILESSTVDQEYFSADISKLEKDKNEAIKIVMKNKTKNNFEDCVFDKTSLLITMNKLSTVKTGKSFDEQIAHLKSEKNSLISKGGTVYNRIYAPKSGFYYSACDGFENKFSPDVLENITLDEFDKLISNKPEQEILENNAGKLVTKSEWFLMCKLSKEETSFFEEGNNYTLIFPYSSNVEIQMNLSKIVNETDKNQVLLIFSSNFVPENFDFTRIQMVQIVSKKISGLKVPKSAMRMLDDTTKGVYVLVGETVRFRRAQEIYSGDDFYIIRQLSDQEKAEYAKNENTSVQNTNQTTENSQGETNISQSTQQSETLNQEKNYKYLELYDNIIIGGKELFDGKRIN